MADVEVKMTSNRKELEKELKEAVERALEAVGLTAEAYAKLDCPVDTGRLRNSISHAVDVNEEAAYIGTNVEYAPYVEYGTRRMAPRPYLKPAATEHGEEYTEIFEKYLKGT
jgi:HK97 gp10 family phage protein